jgi:hypothetical protein
MGSHRIDAGLPIFTGHPSELTEEQRAWIEIPHPRHDPLVDGHHRLVRTPRGGHLAAFPSFRAPFAT